MSVGPAFGPALRQPDQRSCGPSCLVVARMVLDPAYAAEAQPRFGAEVLATHRRVTGSHPAAGALQLPWPRALGTPPWAVAREMDRITGRRHSWTLARWSRETAYDRILGGLRGGVPVPVYVGSRLLPRHVVLALAEEGGGLRVYDPSRGRPTHVDAGAFRSGRLGLGRWDTPWFVVAP